MSQSMMEATRNRIQKTRKTNKAKLLIGMMEKITTAGNARAIAALILKKGMCNLTYDQSMHDHISLIDIIRVCYILITVTMSVAGKRQPPRRHQSTYGPTPQKNLDNS